MVKDTNERPKVLGAGYKVRDPLIEERIDIYPRPYTVRLEPCTFYLCMGFGK